MSSPKIPINVFNYLDPIEYLNQIYDYLKINRKYFSLRSWANQLGFGEATPISQILKRKRSIPSHYVQAFSNYLKLNEKESEYFLSIVEFTNAKHDDVRNIWLQKAQKLFSEANLQRKWVDAEEFEFFYDNLKILMLELVELRDFRLDPAWIKAKLILPIDEERIIAIYEDLFEKGFLEKDQDGKISKSEQHLSSIHDVSSVWIKKFHEIALKNAMNAVYQQEIHEREFGSYILPIKMSELPNIKKKIRDFSQELISTYDTTNNQADSVYQFNINLFAQAKIGELK